MECAVSPDELLRTLDADAVPPATSAIVPRRYHGGRHE
jgi:hypothetical protein